MNDKYGPLVSICIPTYNRAQFINKAIESALNQTYTNIEVIVVDNASADNTEYVVSRYTDPRLKCFKNEKNIGMFANFNHCLELANGKYIQLLHSDDYIDNDFIEKCVTFLESHENICMTFTPARVIEDDKLRHINRLVTFMTEGGTFEHEKNKSYQNSDNNGIVFHSPDGFIKLLSEGNYINCPSVILRSIIINKVGPFIIGYPYAGDYYQWLKITKNYDIAYVTNTYYNYRSGEHSGTYELNFVSLIGWFDLTRTLIKILEELSDEERVRYRGALNKAFEHDMKSKLRSSVYFLERDTYCSPYFLIGLAFCSLSYIHPDTIKTKFTKFKYLCILIAFIIILILPGMQYAVKWYKRSFQRFRH